MCNAVSPSDSGSVLAVYNTHLLESSSFVVLPAVGSLHAGHVLVVSREHYPNLGSMPRAAIREYVSLVDGVQARLGGRLGGWLEAEHGATDGGDTGGACITHVHVNLIPNHSQLVDMFRAQLAQKPVRHDLQDLSGELAPYILLRTDSDVRLHEAVGVPSQLIRRRICQLNGREDWDWGAFPQLDVVESTIAMWRQRV